MYDQSHFQPAANADCCATAEQRGIAFLIRKKLLPRRWIRSGWALTTAMALTSIAAYGQTEVACGAALSQLQGYVQQVNTIAQVEYSQGIPARCGFNGYCAQVLFQQLSAWYAQQSAQVNQWYATIARQCSSQRVTRRRQDNPKVEIDDVDDLEVDDEDKTVRIRIPSQPNGFSRRTR